MEIVRQEDFDHYFGKPEPLPKRAINFSQHRDMCERAAKWLRGTMGCNLAVWELVACAAEKPDAIGWKPFKSILVECKTSRADFLRDKLKSHKKSPEKGMGNYRYYFCPPDVIKVEDLPERWGLLYLKSGKVSIVQKAVKQEANLFVERTFLVSILRRKMQGCGYLERKLSGNNPLKPEAASHEESML